MLVNTRGGNNYSEDEYRDWLQKTGFDQIERVRLPGPTDIMLATRR